MERRDCVFDTVEIAVQKVARMCFYEWDETAGVEGAFEKISKYVE